MIYTIATIAIIIFLGLVFIKFAYYVLFSDMILLISGMIAFFLSILAIADFLAEVISNLIKKYYER